MTIESVAVLRSRRKKESVIYRNPARWLEISQSIWPQRARCTTEPRKKSQTRLESGRNEREEAVILRLALRFPRTNRI